MKIAILTPISDPNYYSMYKDIYWDSIRKALVSASLEKDLSFNICIGTESTVNEHETSQGTILSRMIARESSECVSLGIVESVTIYETAKTPGRFELLCKAFKDVDADYYTFVDFDDELDKNYFLKFNDVVRNEEIKPEIVVAQAVRKKGDLIMPKPYLVWRKEGDESDTEMFINGRYGNVIWGRFFSRDLVKRVCEAYKDDNTIDRKGWGEEYVLHTLLFFSSQTALKFCDSMYLWNYGTAATTLSKRINEDEAKGNINASVSLPIVDFNYKERLRNRLYGLLETCIAACPVEKDPQKELPFND